MTLANNYNLTRQLANGVSTSFSFTYDMINADYATVYQEIDGVQTIVDSDLYTVEFNTNGGNVIFKTPPAAGTYIVIGRDVPLDQIIPYRTSSGFPANRVEENLDKLTGITQQLSNESDRSPKIPIGLQNINMNLPFPSSGKALVWNQTGNALINSSINIDETIEDVTEQANIATQKANEAQNSSVSASSFAGQAESSALNASASASASAGSAEEARKWAVGTLEEQPAGSSEYWAGEAKTAAENADNGYELFQASWFDHKPESASWLRADTFSWQDGGVYFAAYNELSDQYADETSTEETDTVGDIAITYKRSPKGYKICAPDQADTIAALYENTGVAWYYILDIENTRFKLPRTKWGFVGCRNNVGNYVPESLPNIAGKTAPGMHSLGAGINQEAAASALRTVRVGTWGVNNSANNTEFQQANVNLNASRSSSAYQDGAPVQQRSVEMYLYFFVGNTVKADTVIDTGQITEALNGKLDIDLSNLPVSGKSKIAALGMPTKRGSDMTLNASGNSYTAPANGYFNVVLNCGGKWANISTSTGLYTAYGNNTYANANFPVKKGDKITITYESGVTANRFRFIYAEGENE